MTETKGARPLAGVRVLDLSTMIAGPTTASLLADFGAEVVKVERPGVGDPLRQFGAQKSGRGLYWRTLSRNKASVALDLHHVEAQAILRDWIPQFDVLVENFRPGTLERWNVGPDQLMARHPALVVLRVTAFGQSGPYRDRPGFGTLAEAMSGIAAVTGYSDRPPLLPAFPLADIMAGYLGASASLAAAWRAKATGQGEVIDLAIYEAIMKLIELQILEYDQNGTLHERRGNQIEDTAPRGAYQCRDGLWLALSTSTPSTAMRLLQAIGGDALSGDPRFQTNADRVRHADLLDDLVAQWCRERPRALALAELEAMDCAAGPLEDVATMLENPQVRARESVTTVEDPVLGSIRMLNTIPHFMNARPAHLSPGPDAVGADTLRVLQRDLGLTEPMLADLARRGVIGIGS
ncbi:CaiB/BaiF CoA transferase family protein [Sulfobacillus harzensis]|uniref:CoA transferase n=1 Tax=Sulfobacillus harzensis TaxID=2729629 RepID=A0A7Y0L6F5_9FIRM|nr:CoA transferase [Sulfobacillus harzensis]NMP24111.1 CoA transferase [Sulfobacillus harzensis]